MLRVSQQPWNVGLVYKLSQKLRVSGLVNVVLVAADDAALTQLVTLILFTNWCYTQKCLGKK